MKHSCKPQLYEIWRDVKGTFLTDLFVLYFFLIIMAVLYVILAIFVIAIIGCKWAGMNWSETLLSACLSPAVALGSLPLAMIAVQAVLSTLAYIVGKLGYDIEFVILEVSSYVILAVLYISIPGFLLMEARKKRR